MYGSVSSDNTQTLRTFTTDTHTRASFVVSALGGVILGIHTMFEFFYISRNDNFEYASLYIDTHTIHARHFTLNSDSQ